MSTAILDVLIIGAGASGLQCARSLLNSKTTAPSSLVVLEANDYYGGRIKTHQLPLPPSQLPHTGVRVDLGAEFVHGTTTLLNELIRKQGFETSEAFTAAHGDGGPEEHATAEGMYGVYFIGKEKKLIKFDDKSDSDFNAVNAALKAMMDIDPNEVADTTSIGSYLESKSIPERMMSMAVAGYANTVGCCKLNEISLKRTIQYERFWDDNDGNKGEGGGESRILKGFGEVVNTLVDGLVNSDEVSLKENLRLSRVVKSVEYGNGSEGSTVTTTSGEVFRAKKILISVPHTILLSDNITFSPPLPSAKLDGARMLKMDNAAKLYLIFTERVWPAQVQNCICSDCLIPEMWYRYCDVTKLWICTCFFTSDLADNVVKVGKESATVQARKQLFDMYGIENESLFVTSELYNWNDTKSIQGGYSHPLPGITLQHCYDLAAPVDDVLFFAGEATHKGACLTCHSAMETGVRAADEIKDSFAASQVEASLSIASLA